MIEIKGHYLDFLKNIDDLFNIVDKKNSLNSLELNIIKELMGLVKGPKFYYIPQHVEDYEYPKNTSNDLMFDENYVIETDIESYDLVSKNVRMKTYTPTIYFYIKEHDKNFEQLSLISNSKIKNNLFFAVRKYNGHWQIPSMGFSVLENKLYIVELFKKRHFDFVQSQQQVNIKECLNIIIKKTHDLHKNHIQTLNNKHIDFLSYPLNNIDYKAPSFLFHKINKPDVNRQALRQEDDNNYKDALDDLYYYGVRLQ